MLLEHQFSNPGSRTALASAPIKYRSAPLLHDTHSTPFICLCAFLTLLLTGNAPEKARFGKPFTKRSPRCCLCSAPPCPVSRQGSETCTHSLMSQVKMSGDALPGVHACKADWVYRRFSKQNPSDKTST